MSIVRTTLGASLATLSILFLVAPASADPDKAMPELTRDQPTVYALQPWLDGSVLAYTSP